MGKIVFLGDSLTASLEAGKLLTDRWVYRVGIAAGYAAVDIINKGVSGNKSADMLARFQTDVVAYSPDVLVLMLTVNDKFNNVPIATHEANYRAIISQAQALGVKVVVLSPPMATSNVESWRPWVEVGEKIAGEMGCHYIDVWREYAYAAWYWPNNAWYNYLYVDYIHQTAAGETQIFTVCTRATHAGAFVKSAPSQPPAGECPECPPVSAELQSASEDLLLNGATVARLERLQAALPQ